MDIPTIDQIEAELRRESHKSAFGRVVRSTIYALLIVAATAVLVAVMVFPVLQINGSSMTETLWEGDIVVALSGAKYSTGDVIAFYYNNTILVKRVIAVSGDWVEIDETGNVSVNGEMLNEPYITEKAYGNTDIKLPYQVPEGKVFVMGDHRATSIDSRNSAVGCISDEFMVGKILFRVWPLSKFGMVK